MADLPTFGSGVVPEELIRAMLLEEHSRLSREGTLMGDTFQQNWGVDPVYQVGALNEQGSGPVIDQGATFDLLGIDRKILFDFEQHRQAATGNFGSFPVQQVIEGPPPTATVVPLVGQVVPPSSSYLEASGGFVGGRLGRVFFTGIRNRQITGIRVGTMPMVVMGPGSSRPASYVPGGGTGDTYFSED